MNRVIKYVNDKLWPVIEAGSGDDGDEKSYTLQWNTFRGGPAETNEQLTAKTVHQLADAIAYLEEHGLMVNLGRSTRGYTYLNIETAA